MATLNGYQQSKQQMLDKINGMTPDQLAASNGQAGLLSNTGSLNDLLGTDLIYRGYASDYNDNGSDSAKKLMDQRYQQLADMWNSGSKGAVGQVTQSNYTQQQQQAQNGVAYSLAHPDQDDSFMDKLMGNVFPMVIGGFMGAGALGLLGDGAAAAGATGSAGAGASAAGGAGGTLSSTVGMSAAGIPTITTVGAAGGAGAGLGALPYVGLGAGIGVGAGAFGTDPAEPSGTPNTEVDPNIPQIPVVGSTGSSGLPASTLAGGAGIGLLGAGALGALDSGASNLPSLSNIGGVNVPESSLPPLVMPSLNGPSSIPNSDLTPPEGNSLTSGPGGISLPGSGIPGLTPSSILGGLGTLAGGIADYHMNNADKDYYQSIIDKLNGMYNPGTPEANLMQSQMDAKDAAAGRNSQYGTRSMNLAGILNQQRSNIMTSPGYVTLAQDARGHYDNSLNGLFSAVGQASTAGSNLNGLLNSGIGSAINTGIKSAGSYLGNLFGGS